MGYKTTAERTAAHNRWRAKMGPEKYRAYRRRWKYGDVPPKPSNCDCCGTPFATTRNGACVDHDHRTEKVRGWLCQHCNVALGFVDDSRDRLQLLINYLDRAELLS
jgi:hypothetical protein